MEFESPPVCHMENTKVGLLSSFVNGNVSSRRLPALSIIILFQLISKQKSLKKVVSVGLAHDEGPYIIFTLKY